MALVDLRDMLRHAYLNRYAVGAFQAASLEFLDAIVGAAQARRAPVILSMAEAGPCDFETAMTAAVAAARRATVPVAIRLTRAASLDAAVRGIRLGCNGVTVAGAHLPFERNVAAARAVADMAQGCGVPVAGELDCAAGPQQAAAYREATRVDFLALPAGIDLERLAGINAALGIPLAAHGEPHFGRQEYQVLIENGIAEIECSATLEVAAATAVRDHAGAGYADLMRGVGNAVAEMCGRLIALFGAEGRAEAVLQAARRWREVAHVIVYNADGGGAGTVEEMMSRGQAALGTIPGVREVAAGRAVSAQARYPYCWLIRFAHAAVIESYRTHPVHTAFADREFRPRAKDRLTIDYELLDP